MKTPIRMMIVIAVTLALSQADAKPLRIVQLDLARQMETTSFISNYIDRVSAWGFDTLELYLEARVGTKTFSLPEGERYTPEQMKGIVAHAAEKGMTVVPVVCFATDTLAEGVSSCGSVSVMNASRTLDWIPSQTECISDSDLARLVQLMETSK